MKSAVTVSLVPEASGGPFVFQNGLAAACAKAAELGFDAVEIFPRSAESIQPDELSAVTGQHRLRVAAVGTGAGWLVQKLSLTHPEPDVRKRACVFIKEIITLAAAVGAPAIIGSMQGRQEHNVSRAQAIEWLREALEDLGRHASACGQPLLFEPLNRYETNLFNRLADVTPFLESLSTTNIRILADLFHMNIEETSVPEALRAAARYLGHIHFADSNRWAVGLGHTDMRPIISVLQVIGYQGYLSAEVFPRPDSDTAARQTIESFRRYTLTHA